MSTPSMDLGIYSTSSSPSNGNQRRINLSNADRVIDRFIPRAAHNQTYRTPRLLREESLFNLHRAITPNEDTSTTDDSQREEDMNFSLRNEHITARPTVGHASDIEADTSESSADHIQISRSGYIRNQIMARALGFVDDNSRVLTYGSNSRPSSHHKHQIQMIDTSESQLMMLKGEQKAKKKKKKFPLKLINPYKILNSIGLRDDFYTNLVSWSKKSDSIIVGLNNRAFIWSENKGVMPLEAETNELITCVSFSNEEYVAVGTQNGRVLLYDQTRKDYLAAAFSERSLCCITWLADATGLFTGNDAGQVSYYELRNSEDGVGMLRVCSFGYHYQQICGISISNDSRQIAIGCNDNSCTVWDISVRMTPKLKFILPHNAAVKAIAYCPWSTALLATGGGSKDRTIRFWHSKTGTLLDSAVTTGQITSLIWSPNKKQISATFGFTESDDPMLIAVYGYPKMDVLLQANTDKALRALSGVASPDGNSICIAVSDETIRFYELWSNKDRNLGPEAQEEGIFGSNLLEMSEDVIRPPLSLR